MSRSAATDHRQQDNNTAIQSNSKQIFFNFDAYEQRQRLAQKSADTFMRISGNGGIRGIIRNSGKFLDLKKPTKYGGYWPPKK